MEVDMDGVIQTERQIDRQTERQILTQTQTHRHTGTPTHRRTDTPTQTDLMPDLHCGSQR
eukprot:3030866-Rhodomonas_salina.1